MGFELDERAAQYLRAGLLRYNASLRAESGVERFTFGPQPPLGGVHLCVLSLAFDVMKQRKADMAYRSL